MKNKLSLIDLLNEITTPAAAFSKIKFPFSKLPKKTLDDLVTDITPRLVRNEVLVGTTALEKLTHYAKTPAKLKIVMTELLNLNILSKKDVAKLLTKANPDIVDDIERTFRGLSNADDIARAKTKIRLKYSTSFDAIPDSDIVEEFIESNRIRLLRNIRKSLGGGFTSFKGPSVGLKVTWRLIQAMRGKGFQSLKPAERTVFIKWLITGVGNWREVSIILRRGKFTKESFIYATSHIVGQLVQKYFFWGFMFTAMEFVKQFISNGLQPNQKYSTKSEALTDLISSSAIKGFSMVGFEGVMPVSIIIKFFLDNIQGGTFYIEDVDKLLQIAKAKKDQYYNEIINSEKTQNTNGGVKTDSTKINKPETNVVSGDTTTLKL